MIVENAPKPTTLYTLYDLTNLPHSAALIATYQHILCQNAPNKVVICDFDGPLMPLGNGNKSRFGLPTATLSYESSEFLSDISEIPSTHLIIYTSRLVEGAFASFLSDGGHFAQRVLKLVEETKNGEKPKINLVSQLEKIGISRSMICVPSGYQVYLFMLFKVFEQIKAKIGLPMNLYVDCSCPYALYYLGDSQRDLGIFTELASRVNKKFADQGIPLPTYFKFPSKIPYCWL